MDAVTSPALWSTVAALPDYLLLAQTRQLARHEQALQILVLDHLREIEARRLHLTRGYGSLFDYVVHELGYTAAAAWRRIKAMRLCSQTGGARELLQDGRLNLSNAAQLQNLFERSDRSRGRPPGGDGRGGGLGGAPRSDGEPGAQAPGESAPAEPMSAGGCDPAPPAAGPAPAAGPVLDTAAREELVRQAAGKSTREVQQMLAEVDPELARPSDRMRALGGGRWELKAAVDAECRHGLEKLQMLLSHTDPHLTLGGLVARLVRDGLDRYDPERPHRARRTGGRGSADGAHSASTPARRDTEPVQRNVGRAKGNDTGAVERNVARAEGGGVERRSEVERDDASFGAAVRIGTARPSAAKRAAEAEHGSTKSAPAGSSGGHSTSPVQRCTPTEPRRTSRAARRVHGGRAASAAKRDTEADGGSTKSAAVKRAGQDRDAHIERAEHRGGAAASAPGRSHGAEHSCAQQTAMRGNGGRTASLAKRQGRAGGDGWGAAEPQLDAGERNALWAPVRTDEECDHCADPRDAGKRNALSAPVRDRHWFTWAAKRLADAAGHGAVGPAERSPALERHLAALRCCGAVPGARSRYIPAAVRREVWRRDQGCCSYVDRGSGRHCGSRYRLEIDHIVPFALGGGAEPANLRLRCDAHHRLRHAQRHVYAESVPAETRCTRVIAIDPKERGRMVGSHAAFERAGE